jgi:hypothetical protein
VFCLNVIFVYLVVYVICIVLTLPPAGQPICSTMMIIIIIIIITIIRMFPVKYELGSYIPEDDIPHSHCLKNLKSYITLTSWNL